MLHPHNNNHETSHTDSQWVENVPYWCQVQRSRSHCIDYWKWLLVHNCFPFTSVIINLETQIPSKCRICPNDIGVKNLESLNWLSWGYLSHWDSPILVWPGHRQVGFFNVPSKALTADHLFYCPFQRVDFCVVQWVSNFRQRMTPLRSEFKGHCQNDKTCYTPPPPPPPQRS